ncbi:MAG: tRNA(m(1)G37)methyltransferase [Chrysothrix sp. TS-e1954]|nr:MAG: tRNA(m(1)G37)methyltransferase [Chrysothrix sp. TS-e1954]
MLRPPINRAMLVLDRGFFQKDIQISAARVHDVRHISRVRSECVKSRDVLPMRAIAPVRLDPTDASCQRRCLLLRPEIKYDDNSSWGETVARLSTAGDISLFPYNLHLGYEHWSALEILQAILPEDLQDEIPAGFHHVGHIAHFNLRDRYLAYKSVIGQVAIDKNSTIKTVVNKTDTLDSDNEFRVLETELIAGEPKYRVEVREQNCTFQFDFSKVFWNSKQGFEHERLVDKFQPGEAVCDAMAGVGPFAIPAAKKGVFVWANDLNPHCFEGLNDSIRLNKVSNFARAFNEDGHRFISSATQKLMSTKYDARVPIKTRRTDAARRSIKPSDHHLIVTQPKTFSHYVMNLPATAMDFLPDFIGLFAGHEQLFAPHTSLKLPMIHCYCFETKADESDDDFVGARMAILRRVSAKLKHPFTNDTPDLEIRDVRDVAPKKHDFCMSLRLPAAVAFAIP